jgi:hypothetical protein
MGMFWRNQKSAHGSLFLYHLILLFFEVGGGWDGKGWRAETTRKLSRGNIYCAHVLGVVGLGFISCFLGLVLFLLLFCLAAMLLNLTGKERGWFPGFET